MEQNQDAKWGLSARGLLFLVGFCSVFGSKCLEGQRPHFLGIMVFGGAVSGRGWTWPARGGGGAGGCHCQTQKLQAAWGQLFPVSRHLPARYVRPPGHSTRRRQLSPVPTWQLRSPGLSQEFPFHSWKKCLARGFSVGDRKGRRRKERAFERSEALFRA